MQIIYCQEIIQQKEIIIIQLCIQSRAHWVITAKKNYFFSHKSNRRDYQNIYNYYSLDSCSKFFPNQLDNYNISLEKNQKVLETSEAIEKIFQEIGYVKKFLLIYEQKYHSRT